MIESLKGYDIIKGVRGQKPVAKEKLKEMVIRLSALVKAGPELLEIDLNPCLGSAEEIVTVDARIRIEK